MHQEPPDEFCAVQCDPAFGISRSFASGRKGNLILCDGEQSAVGDCNPVGIASKVFHGIAEAIKGLLNIGTPVFFIKCVFPFIPKAGITQLFTGRRKDKGAAFVKGCKPRHIFALELIPQDFYRDKKCSGGSADFSIPCKPAAGKNTVHMHMVSQLLVPGVEDLDDAGLRTEILLIRGQFQERFGAASVEEAVEEVLVAANERVQFMGEGEDHMEIGCVNDLGPALVHPDFLKDGLAVWAVSVAAGIIVEIHVPALGALAYVVSEFSGFAVQDGMCGFFLNSRLEMSLCAISPVGQLKYFPDF